MRYNRDRYETAEAALDAVGDVQYRHALLADPDIQAALSAIRNAERAIAARASDLDEFEGDGW